MLDNQPPLGDRYFDKANKTDFVELGPNGTFTLFQSGKTYEGTYEVTGDTVIASGPRIRGKVQLHIVGNTLTYSDGTVYENQAAPQVSNIATPQAPPAPVAAPPPVPLPDIAPPPPPTDAPPVAPPTIAIGQTMDQVTAGFGQPLKVAKLGAKVFFYYKDMKVTFTNGKVSDVE